MRRPVKRLLGLLSAALAGSAAALVLLEMQGMGRDFGRGLRYGKSTLHEASAVCQLPGTEGTITDNGNLAVLSMAEGVARRTLSRSGVLGVVGRAAAAAVAAAATLQPRRGH